MTYDVVFHPDAITMGFLGGAQVHKFICDTAVDGVNRVLAMTKEHLSKDYKLMKNLRCKGGKPASLTVKMNDDESALANADVEKHQTAMQKELTAKKEKHEADKKAEDSDEEDHLEDDIVEKPEGIT